LGQLLLPSHALIDFKGKLLPGQSIAQHTVKEKEKMISTVTSTPT